MAGHGEKYTRLRDRAISALLAAPTVLEAAERLEIGDATLRHWMKRADFKKRFEEAQQSLVDAAAVRLKTNALLAVDTLAELLGSTNPPAIRLNAVTETLDRIGVGVGTPQLESLRKQIQDLRDELRNCSAAEADRPAQSRGRG